jgi:hypothetical protein
MAIQAAPSATAGGEPCALNGSVARRSMASAASAERLKPLNVIHRPIESSQKKIGASAMAAKTDCSSVKDARNLRQPPGCGHVEVLSWMRARASLTSRVGTLIAPLDSPDDRLRGFRYLLPSVPRITPAGTSVTRPAAAAASMASTDVSGWPLTVVARPEVLDTHAALLHTTKMPS